MKITWPQKGLKYLLAVLYGQTANPWTRLHEASVEAETS